MYTGHDKKLILIGFHVNTLRSIVHTRV